MEYSGTFSVVPGNFRKKHKKFLTNPIHTYIHTHTGSYISLQPIQNCKKLLKTYDSQEKLVAIHPQTGPKPMNNTHR